MTQHKPHLTRTPALAALMLPLLLVSCGGGSGDGGNTSTQKPTPQLTTIDLAANKTQLKLGDTPTLQVTLKDQNGQPMQLPVTFTSSLPDIVKVDANGKLSSDRLTPTSKPAVITVTAGGKTATLNVETYGLELRVGTSYYDTPQAFAKLAYGFWRLRTKDELKTFNNKVVIKNPDGNELSGKYAGYDMNIVNKRESTSHWLVGDGPVEPKSGVYRAAVTVDGINYEAAATLKDSARFLPPVKNIKSVVGQGLVKYTATAPAETKMAQVYFYNGTTGMGQWRVGDNFPITYLFSGGQMFGTLKTLYCIGDFPKEMLSDKFEPMLPDQMNTSCTEGDTFVEP